MEGWRGGGVEGRGGVEGWRGGPHLSLHNHLHRGLQAARGFIEALGTRGESMVCGTELELDVGGGTSCHEDLPGQDLQVCVKLLRHPHLHAVGYCGPVHTRGEMWGWGGGGGQCHTHCQPKKVTHLLPITIELW